MSSDTCISNIQAYLQAVNMNNNITGLGSAVLHVYSTAHDRPLDADTAIGTQLELIRWTLPIASANTISPYGVITIGAMPMVTALNTGIASWFRVVASDGITVVLDGNVGLAGEDFDLLLSSLNIIRDAPMRVLSFTHTIQKR